MRFYNLIYFTFLFGFCIGAKAQTNIKTMFHNILNYDDDFKSNSRTIHLKKILEYIQPDLFLVCELKSKQGSDYLFNNAILPFNSKFKKAPFAVSFKNPPLLQMAYYNSEKLVLETSKAIPTTLRDINHYTFKINSNTNPIYLEVFVTHLKASTGTSNRAVRLSAIRDFMDYLNKIPSDRHVLFAGDLNFYTSNEEGYQSLIDSRNAIVMVDPINRPAERFPNNPSINDPFEFYSTSSRYFWRNSSFANIHTQSTRTFQVNEEGSGGGMDDRFDFIMISENFNSSPDLYYIKNSYKTIGNNGNCYNSFVSNSTCSGTYSQELRNALHQFSDHLPITLDIATPEKTLKDSKTNLSNHYLTYNIGKKSITLTSKETVKSIVVYNQLGQIVHQQKNCCYTTAPTIKTNTFSSGIYYVKINNLIPLKFVKN